MKKNKIKILVAVIIMAGLSFVFQNQTYAKVNYRVTPKKVAKMAKKKHKSFNNKYTQHYLGLNDYLEKMGKKGGGTLTLNKGKYKISNAVCIPSNVTIVLKNGVVIEKINKTGIKKFKPSGSMWQLCPRNKFKKKNSIGKYNGSKNVKIIGEGNAVIDMKNVDGIGLVVAHCKNVEISGIIFKGMNGNHYIECNGSQNVEMHDNNFTKAKQSTLTKYYAKEAINIDLADKETHGLPLDWVKKDKTPCDNIHIYNNVFDGTTRGVGTHKYSQDSSGNPVYHKNILIENNTFKNIFDNGVFVLTWKDAVIKNNTFYNIGTGNKKSYSSGAHGISGGGIDGINITGNSFEKIKRNAIYFIQQQNVGAGSQYKKVNVNITKEQTEAMTDNTVKNCGNDANPNYAGYDVLYFRNNSTKSRENGVGIDLVTKNVYYGIPKNK